MPPTAMNDRPSSSPGRPPAQPGSRLWLVFLLVAVGIVTWLVVPPFSLRADRPRDTGREVTPRGPLSADENRTIELFRDASPSVVFITTHSRQRDFFSMRVYERPRGSGSGFIWDDRGHVVTNFHVIEGSDRATVTLADQTNYNARLIGFERHKDLAVLRIEAPPAQLRALPIGTSSDLEVGQKVLAIGNPFGLDQTLTTGIISALGREIQSVSQRPIQDVIQTDAAINPGNSGGPLLDSAGRLIGVNTAIYSPSGAYAGIGFAVPVDTVNRIVPQLIEHGRVIRPGLGIGYFDDNTTRRLARQNPAYRQGGVLVREVMRGSAAEEAGIRPTTQTMRGRVRLGDLIIAIGGERVRTLNDLFRYLDQHAVGEQIVVRVLREGRELDLDVTVQGLEGS